MKAKIREKENVVILDLEGNIDINASNFIETVGWVLIHRSKNILCNFEEVNIVDYLGISLIAVAYKNVLNHKRKMKIYNLPAHVAKLFSIVGLNKAMEFYQSEEQAIASFQHETALSEIMQKQLRRRFKRIELNAPIDYKSKIARDTLFYQGKIFNLSVTGAFVLVDKTFPSGSVLTTKLHLLPKPGIIEVEAKVIWATEEKIQPLESQAMGLEFYDIPLQQEEEMITFVEKHLTHIAAE